MPRSADSVKFRLQLGRVSKLWERRIPWQ